MKIKLFCSILCLIAIPLFSTSYNKTKKNLKSAFYDIQVGLMGPDEYDMFIGPYIQEAEITLAVTQYYIKNPDSQTSKDYLMCLLDYNVACFHNYVRSNSLMITSKAKEAAKRNLEIQTTKLLSAIEHIKQEAQLKNLNTKEELRKTTQLFQKANAKYYKKLPIKFKLLLPLTCQFNFN